jgi:hypothetical protein
VAEDSYPADNVDFDSSQWRNILRVLGNGILDPQDDAALSYKLPSPLPSSGNSLTLGPGSSLVQGFGHTVPDGQAVTIPAAVGGTQVSTVVVRYDPARTSPNPDYDSGDPDSPATLGVPCKLTVLTGTAGGGVPTLTQDDNGVWDLPLYNITRAVGASLSAATVTDRRTWLDRTAATSADPGNGGTPTKPVVPKPGRRSLVTGTGGRVTVTFDEAFDTVCHSVTGLVVESTSGWTASLYGTPTKGSFVAAFRDSNGAPFLSGKAVVLNYLAWGY